GADDILARCVPDDGGRIFLVDLVVADPFIPHQQADLVRDAFADEGGEGRGLHVVDHAGNHLSFPGHGADHWRLARPRPAAPAAIVAVARLATALGLVPVLGLATDECLVNLDDPQELAEILIGHCHAEPMAHVPSRFVRPEAHVTHDLERAHALL